MLFFVVFLPLRSRGQPLLFGLWWEISNNALYKPCTDAHISAVTSVGILLFATVYLLLSRAHLWRQHRWSAHHLTVWPKTCRYMSPLRPQWSATVWKSNKSWCWARWYHCAWLPFSPVWYYIWQGRIASGRRQQRGTLHGQYALEGFLASQELCRWMGKPSNTSRNALTIMRFPVTVANSRHLCRLRMERRGRCIEWVKCFELAQRVVFALEQLIQSFKELK